MNDSSLVDGICCACLGAEQEEMNNIITLPYTEFCEYLREGSHSGVRFTPFVDDEGDIKICYKYGDYKNGKSEIKYRVAGYNQTFSMRYTGSSPFAMWWCGLTDGSEEEDEYHCDDCCEKVGSDDYAGCCNDGDCPKSVEHLCTACGAWDDDAQVWRCKDCNDKKVEEEENE